MGFEIVRNDGMVMFNGSPMVDGAPPVDLETGMSFAVRIHFRANVLRGTYRVVLHVSDTNNLWPPIDGVGSGVIHRSRDDARRRMRRGRAVVRIAGGDARSET